MLRFSTFAVSVGKVPEGSDHKAYLAKRVRDTVVKEGYEPEGIVADIQKNRPQRGIDKNRSVGMMMEKTMGKRG